MKRLSLSILSAIAIVVSARSEESVSPDSALVLSSFATSRFFPQSFDSPSGTNYRLPYSLNTLNVDFTSDRRNLNVSGPTGNGASALGIEADAYVKHRGATLYGSAAYRNGTIRDVRWNETADLVFVYPYITADAIGGNMRMETYSFGGGYAGMNNRAEWGAAASYTAGLYYRNVDPRPKNLSGILRIAAGGGIKLDKDYSISLSAEYMRYTQSSDIRFFSETGETKIYHATGLGTHYVRFAGTGKSSHYSGNAFIGSLSLTPGFSRGFVATVGGSIYSFSKIIDDLNSLPLAKASERSLFVEAGWRSADCMQDYGGGNAWAFKGTALLTHRTGHENVFGDASSGIYPQTGSEERFHANLRRFVVSLLWQSPLRMSRSFSLEAEGGYSRQHQNHRDPVRYFTVNSLYGRLKAMASFSLPLKIHASFMVCGTIHNPLKSDIYLEKKRQDDDRGLTSDFTESFRRMASNSGTADLTMRLSKSVGKRIALYVDARFGMQFIKGNSPGKGWSAAIGATF